MRLVQRAWKPLSKVGGMALGMLLAANLHVCRSQEPAASRPPSPDRPASLSKPARDRDSAQNSRAQTAAPDSDSDGAAGKQPIAADVLAAWVRQLDDDRFARREVAQHRLLTNGMNALDEVARAAAEGSLESSTRAVNILLQWAQSADAELSLAALERLAKLTNRPAESAMAGERLSELRELAAVKAIEAMGARVGPDQQLAAFVGMTPPLQIVIGPHWTGGADGLRYLADIRRATTISFHSAPIGETAARQLESLTHVQRIEFYSDGAALSPEAVEALKKALPQAMIEVRSGAKLGIAGMPVPGGAGVRTVQPGSAAEKAGVHPGDVISQIGGVDVSDFEALTREIAKARAGEVVILKVIRQGQGQPVDIAVTFDRWGEDQLPQAGMPDAVQPFGAIPLGGPRPIIIQNRR